MVTSVQSNPMPAGGVAAQQPVPSPGVDPTAQATTAEFSMPALMAFRQQSTPLEVPLDTQSIATPVSGNQLTSRISNVGLGYMIVTKHTATWFVSNSGAGVQTVNLGKTFPWSVIGNTQVQINGGAVVYSVSGYGGLLVAGRPRRGFFGQTNILGTQVGLSTTLVQLTFGAGLSAVAGNSLSGVAQISVTNGTVNALFTAVWYTFEKLAFTRDGLLGCLPLQNNSTFATVQRTLAPGVNLGINGATGNVAPFSASGANTTVVMQSYKYDQTYRFWSVPSNPQLYAPMVQNSYQVLEQAANIANATGSFAATYNLPQNNYLTALHIVAQDSAVGPNYIVPSTVFTNFRLQYNAGSVVPVNREIRRHEAMAWLDYQYQPEDLAGYLLWDGNDTTEDIVSTDTAGWVNLYDTANPQFQFDISGGPTLPVTFSAIRESVVAGAVAVVGG